MNHEILVKIGGDISGLSKGISEAQSQLKTFSSDAEAGFKAIGTAGKVVTGAGVALAGGLGFAVKTSMDFQTEMARVGALSGATDDELRQLTETAKEMGRTTSFTSTQSAEALSFLSMAGYSASESMDALSGLLNTAAAGQMDLGETADITSNILQSFGIAAKDTGKVADVLTAAFTSSNVTLTDIGETLKYVGPNAAAAGYSLEEMAAATGLLGKHCPVVGKLAA
ncbi:TP901 family phage tail tape measure protein [Alkalihalobacillus xiaoxiensis]|uniref:TP901 family phage tail tape measure protein n=1 Tax=Shouchella xiaoxiensis TaxID=766895 RepID=A0ABS2SS62_9BACI|nr:phage tail tape measure protein [Shouchella xiaoxiensis]MBM7838358.1 TP901 family phage tail tape measure protein [Shouchella xiaoxiensis]